MTYLAHAAGSGTTTLLALLTFLGWIAAIPIAHAAMRRIPYRFDRPGIRRIAKRFDRKRHP